MAIQFRRGAFADFIKSKMVAGETAVVQSGDTNTQNGKAFYVCYAPGSVERILTEQDKEALDNQISDIEEDLEATDQALNNGLATLNQSITNVLNAIPAVDASLTTSGAAADARKTGNEITGLKNGVHQLEGELTGMESTVESLDNRIDTVELASENYVDDGYVEDGVAYFTHNGTVLFEITGIGGGGGGGGGNNAILTVTNTSGFLSKTIATGGECEISLTWSSLEDNIPTGDGSMAIIVNGASKASLQVAQGAVTAEIGQYCGAGSNIVKVQISDVYGNNRTINFTITVIAISISSTFDTSTPFTGTISFPYVPVGAVSKTVYFIVDGQQIGTQVTSASGRQMTYIIPAQSHGAHSLRVYFTAVINEETVRSNELYYDMICLEEGNNTVIIASPFNVTTAPQYTTLAIPFTVYDPQSPTAAVQISANGTVVSTQTVDRTEQSYSYRADNYGTLTIAISSGGTTKTLAVSITESQIDVDPVTDDLALYLSSKGRSNQEAHPETWGYQDISCTLSNFNFVSDGWQTDADGVTVLRVSGDARVTIPYKIFAQDFRTTGKTIELEFATRNVLNYDATILSCFDGGRGIKVTAQKAELHSEQSEIFTQYKEDEHVRIAFVVEKRAENRLIYIYINGIASGVVQYPVDDDFSQVSPVNISIGSNDCTADIYCIRVYDNDLTRHQIVDNWIADTQNGATMLDRWTRNNVYDAYGNIVISKLPSYLPYMIINAPELPQSKGDKKTVSGSYVDPEHPTKSFTFTGAQADVQGTSSQYYPRKNYKIKFKNGFVINGTQSEKYAMNATAVPTDTFTFKADVASSEGANNVELARLYNDACPYKTPAQTENAKVRQGIDGFPIVIYWNDGNETTFIGKYNFNNDKGTEEVFGFVPGDESWEIKNNTSDRVLWKSNDFTGSDWLNDFEARYPDTDPAFEDPAQLAEFATWVKSTDRSAATGNALPNPVVYDGVTYTTDSAAYRLAKFKAEANNYMELQSAMFYYLFTELFLMVDSRAKNAFPSFMGSVIN